MARVTLPGELCSKAWVKSQPACNTHCSLELHCSYLISTRTPANYNFPSRKSQEKKQHTNLFLDLSAVAECGVKQLPFILNGGPSLNSQHLGLQWITPVVRRPKRSFTSWLRKTRVVGHPSRPGMWPRASRNFLRGTLRIQRKPGLAHATLTDDEDLQGSQHVLVHPDPPPLWAQLATRSGSQPSSREQCPSMAALRIGHFPCSRRCLGCASPGLPNSAF